METTPLSSNARDQIACFGRGFFRKLPGVKGLPGTLRSSIVSLGGAVIHRPTRRIWCRILHPFSAKKIYAQTDSTRGKFRSFLLASLKKPSHRCLGERAGLKRGGGALVLLDDELAAVEQEEARDAVSATLNAVQHC